MISNIQKDKNDTYSYNIIPNKKEEITFNGKKFNILINELKDIGRTNCKTMEEISKLVYPSYIPPASTTKIRFLEQGEYFEFGKLRKELKLKSPDKSLYDPAFGKELIFMPMFAFYYKENIAFMISPCNDYSEFNY